MDTEIRKVTEEVASAGKAKVEEFVKLLEDSDEKLLEDSDEKLEEIRQLTDTTELQQKIYNLLQEWLQSQHQHQTDGDTHDRGETFQPETSTEEASPTPRRLLVRYLHMIGLKITGDG